MDGLKISMLLKGEMAGFSDDDVIKDPDPQLHAHTLDLGGQLPVLKGRFWVTTGVVVGQNNTAGLLDQSMANDLPGKYRSLINCALGHDLPGDQPVLVVHKQSYEMLCLLFPVREQIEHCRFRRGQGKLLAGLQLIELA